MVNDSPTPQRPNSATKKNYEISTNNLSNEPGSDIPKFYEGRTIFITGATGFVGKALVEKLLRACPGIKTIYILVRPKSGTSIDTRLAELFDNNLFDTLKRDNPKCFSIVIPIEGDISLPGLGICNDERKKLCDEVSIVVHSAATVKFIEKLRVSIQLNVQGTRSIIELCKQMKGLEAMVQVSTAYSNCERTQVHEVIYPLSAEPGELVEQFEGMTDLALDALTQELIENRPNTYTYTKAMAEGFLNEERGKLPISIVRPSIVTSTWKEPVPGWVDNMSGLTGFIAAWGRGVMRTIEVHGDKVVDLIPVDTLVNLILAAAWNTATSAQTRLIVYNCCSGDQNPVFWRDVGNFCNASLVKNAYDGAVWYPKLHWKANTLWNRVSDFMLHFLPAILMEFGAMTCGRKRRGLRMYRSLSKALSTIRHFTTNEWYFPADNVMRLYRKLSPKDQVLFNFDVKKLEWEKYLDSYCLGVRGNVLKQDISTIPQARKRILKMYWAQRLVQLVLVLYLLFGSYILLIDLSSSEI